MRNASDDERIVRVIFTPQAERHIESLYDYIAERAGEARAEAYITRIVASCLSLTTFPLRGNQRTLRARQKLVSKLPLSGELLRSLSRCT
jgi:plasmid stabilization system protein ParE